MDYKSDESNWNYADAYLKRIDHLFILANGAKMTNNYQWWFECLCALHDELVAHMKTTKGKGEEYSEEDVSKNFRKRARGLLDKGSMLEISVLRNCFSDWEVHMRRVMRSRQMDLPRRDDKNFAVLGGE